MLRLYILILNCRFSKDLKNNLNDLLNLLAKILQFILKFETEYFSLKSIKLLISIYVKKNLIQR